MPVPERCQPVSLADQVANFKKKLRGTGDGGRGVGDEGREKNSESWTSAKTARKGALVSIPFFIPETWKKWRLGGRKNRQCAPFSGSAVSVTLEKSPIRRAALGWAAWLSANPQSLRKKTPASGNVSETVSGRRRSPVRWPLSVPAPRRHYTTAGGFVSINWPMLAVGKCSVVSGCALEAVGAEAMVFDPSAAARCNAHHHHRKQ